MRLFVLLTSLIVGISVILQSRYKIINMLLAVTVIRKLIVSVSMNLPFIRKRLLPMVLGRSAQ